MISANPEHINWPVPEPELPAEVHPALAEAVRAAATAYRAARHTHSRAALAEEVADGADGTPTMRVDALVEDAIAEAAARNGVNLLSEEAGYLDHGSATTLVVDPVDGSANAAAGVPLCAFAGVVLADGTPAEAVTCWLDTGRCWWTRAGTESTYRTSGRTDLAGASVNLLRPKANTLPAWQRVARVAGRVRALSTSCLEAALVAEGSVDAFADPGSDTHRIVDLAAAMVTVPAAGGVVLDVHGRPLEFAMDVTRRWSGVVAATRPLGEQLIATILG
ncbi:inositol monophosphatase family protein [Gandjariella thermophila]|uniref:Inositol monophosphatase n=1 Tax=Gandjariella thermophila TaxID=1931992 RepID=A0A4D4J401_9PSEU|nr:inositol monophosphatase family protein [Gandjariella thermophila]GDY29236.1 inositol monophosphatase [Gandjariella thermophila]